jgi:hypothetical protein
VIPNTGQPGQQNLQVSITGQFTHFAQGHTTADFGAGITVVSLTVNSATSITVTLDIDPAATNGPRTVTVSTSDPEIVTLVNGFTITSVAAATDAFQVRYAANLNVGDSVVNITNTGILNGADPAGRICVNVYTFDPNEELIACCACLVTPNGLKSLSAQNDLINNTLTPGKPVSIVIKLLATTPDPNSGTCDASSPTAAKLAPGLRAWGTTLHALPTTPVKYGTTEAPFSQAELSVSELQKLASYCGFIEQSGSGYGICKSCRSGGLGGASK